MWNLRAFLLAPLLALGCVTPAQGGGPMAQAPADLWDTWGDGQAELDGYRLVQPRYGAPRTGEAVLVFVTETFTEGQRLKSDGGHPDEFPVMKLNDARAFDTGIYPYHLLTSTFVRLDGHDPFGATTKVTASVQEWCGHVWDQLVLGRAGYARSRKGYFDGEGDLDERLAHPAGGIVGDALFLWVRGVAGPWLAPGESRTVPWLPRLTDVRLGHDPLVWAEAKVSRSATAAPITVPAGRFEANVYTVVADVTTTVWVETAAPHRIVRWERSDGETGALTGSARRKYWQEHDPGDEALRATLGLPVPTQAPVTAAPAPPQ
jgi:hypothetical protein